MGIRQYRENRTSVTTATDVKQDQPHIVAMEQLVPQIVRRSRNAVAVDRVEFYFFQRKATGRRCSCYEFESSADGLCGICFGTGLTLAFEKYGCFTEIVDVTHPNLRMFNVGPAYDLATRPVMMALEDGAKTGFIEVDIDIMANTKQVDFVSSNTSLQDRRNSSIKTYIKSFDDLVFVELNAQNLSRVLYAKKATVRIEFNRLSTDVVSPLFSHCMLRYRFLDKPRIIADIPKRVDTNRLADYGVVDQLQEQTMFLADTPRKITLEDFFVSAEEGTRWRVVEVTPNKPLGQLTSHDVTCRSITSSEPYMKVPV